MKTIWVLEQPIDLEGVPMVGSKCWVGLARAQIGALKKLRGVKGPGGTVFEAWTYSTVDYCVQASEV
ncbi:MAG TPA: hypothetical protein EYN96_08705 [Candidatus Hydrogenedentes bacterium]|nr:hypothetical protein [Candidatus Hydrogenedentota bacterium]